MFSPRHSDESPVRVIILTDSLKYISIEIAMTIHPRIITPETPRSRHWKCPKLLGKVDPFPSFLLEMAHAEGA
jgi:hypothetical protein